MSRRTQWGPQIAQNWSSCPYEWQNNLDIRILGQKGSNLENLQNIKIYVIFRSRNQSECCKSGLEKVNICDGVHE